MEVIRFIGKVSLFNSALNNTEISMMEFDRIRTVLSYCKTLMTSGLFIPTLGVALIFCHNAIIFTETINFDYGFLVAQPINTLWESLIGKVS